MSRIAGQTGDLAGKANFKVTDASELIGKCAVDDIVAGSAARYTALLEGLAKDPNAAELLRHGPL